MGYSNREEKVEKGNTEMCMYTCTFKNMYILGLVFGVIGGFITPAFSFILS